MTEYIVCADDFEESYYKHTDVKPETVFGHCLREEIIRCNDCVWFKNSSYYGAYCTNFGSPLGDDYDGFCKWGERRDNGQAE